MRRYRLLIWTDEALVPRQMAIAAYVDDQKLKETTKEVGPFDTWTDILEWAGKTVDIQQTLW